MIPALVVVILIEAMLTTLLIIAAGRTPRGRRNDPSNERENP